MYKLAYISNQVIPSESAESIFVAKSADEIRNKMNITVICPMRKNFYSKQNTKKFYNLKNILDIKYISFFDKLKGKYIIFHFLCMLYIFTKNFDYIYTRTIIGGLVSIVLRKLFILEIHSLPKRGSLDGVIFDFVVNNKKCKKLILISNALKNDIILSYKIDKNKIQVEHDASDFSNELEIINNKSKEIINLGYVGSLYPGKGMEIISEISKVYKDRNDICIHIYGGSKEDIIKWKKKCFDNVKFHGYIAYSDIHNAINSFDICLLPNQPTVLCAGYTNNSTDIGKYTSPMKMFDYISCKKPLISSDLEILREILDEKMCYLSPYDDVNDWCNNIDHIIKNFEHACKKADYAYNFIKEHYNWENRCNRIIENFK